ncbi:MAG: hypothetical protein VW258_11765 [Thalassolituus sp.]
MRLWSLIRNNPLRTVLALLLLASVWDSYHWRTVAYNQRDTMADLNEVLTQQNTEVQRVSSECRVKMTEAAARAVQNLKPVERPARNAEEFNEWLNDLF